MNENHDILATHAAQNNNNNDYNMMMHRKLAARFLPPGHDPSPGLCFERLGSRSALHAVCPSWSVFRILLADQRVCCQQLLYYFGGSSSFFLN